MFKIINKYKVSILWILSITIIFISIIIAQFKPFNDKASAIILWSSFNSALLAMVFSAMRRKNKNKIVVCIILMIYFTIKAIFLFI